MKKTDIKVGGTYTAKVSDKVVEVRIDAEHPSGGWNGTNLATGKTIRVKSAQRLRAPVGKAAPEVAAAVAPEGDGVPVLSIGQVKAMRAKALRDGKPTLTMVAPGVPSDGWKSKEPAQELAAKMKAAGEEPIICCDAGTFVVLTFAKDDAHDARADTEDCTTASERAVANETASAYTNGVASSATTAATTRKRKTKAPRPAKTPKGGARANTAARGAKGAKKAATKATPAKGAPRAKRAASEPNEKRLGILDVAAQILAKSKEPMGCVEIVERALKTQMWTTGGKTPHATLYAAITREIAKKGKAARFEKVERGLFKARKVS